MTKLEELMKQYEIPPIPGLPMGKKVMLYRIPTNDMTAGGLYVPDEHKDVDNRGIILAAGLGARDIMRAHLVEIGDTVWIGRFAGTEKGVETQRAAGTSGKKFLTLSIDDVHVSEDAWVRFCTSYEVRFNNETGEHYYAPRKATK